MQLEYNILWIDNDIQDYIDNNEVNSIKRYLEELGFEPTIVTVDDEAELESYLYLYKYDLIISDFNLNATTGDIIIEKIREEKGFSTEILFYTAKANFRSSPEVKDRLAFMDRITFHSNRDTFLNKVEKVITLTLDKLLELNATRGLITAATSNLDVDIEELVMHLAQVGGINDVELKGLIDSKVYSPLQAKLSAFWDKYDGFQNYFHKIDAVKKWEIFRELLKPLKTDNAIAGFLKVNQTYQKEVIEIRNKFAHSKSVEKDGRIILKGQIGKEDFEFDNDACVAIRKNIITHRKSIKELKKKILHP